MFFDQSSWCAKKISVAEDPDGRSPQRVGGAQVAKGRICIEPVDDVSATEHDERLEWRQRSEVKNKTWIYALAFLTVINVNLLWLKVGIQLLQWCPVTARGRIPVEEWERHPSLQVPGRFGLVLSCFLSNDERVDSSVQIFSPDRVLYLPLSQQSRNANVASRTWRKWLAAGIWFFVNVEHSITGSVSCYCLLASHSHVAHLFVFLPLPSRRPRRLVLLALPQRDGRDASEHLRANRGQQRCHPGVLQRCSDPIVAVQPFPGGRVASRVYGLNHHNVQRSFQTHIQLWTKLCFGRFI